MGESRVKSWFPGDDELEGGVDLAEQVDRGFIFGEPGVLRDVAAVDHYVDGLEGLGVGAILDAMCIRDDKESGTDGRLGLGSHWAVLV